MTRPRGESDRGAVLSVKEALNAAHRSTPSPSPLAGPFRIHAVAEMTGVPEPTLRAWERRYGIPSPERTASGYRLYGLAEVEQVRRMRASCGNGMSAAEAARAARASRDERKGSAFAPSLADGFTMARAALMDAIVRFDDEALEVSLRKIMFMGEATLLVDRVIAPVLAEVGRSWEAGELSIAQEHFATQKILKFLRDLAAITPVAPPSARVVMACFAEDAHELGLVCLAIRLSTWGYRPILLGANTPPGAVRSAVEAVRPALVALSVTRAPAPARARDLLDDYASACGNVPWIVGGRGADAVAALVRERGGWVDPKDPVALRALLKKGRRASRASEVRPRRARVVA